MTRRVFPCPNVSDELPILLRAYVESAAKDPNSARRSEQGPKNASDWSLVFDTETTTDPGQALRIGFCRVYHRDEALVDAMGIDEVRDLVGVAGYSMELARIGSDIARKPSVVEVIASIDEPTFQREIANKIRRSTHHRFVIDLAKGEFDKVKQQSIYVDKQNDGELRQPTLLIDRSTADRIIRLASGAIYTTQMTLRYAQAFRKNYKG
jgi:hypothetical protein